MPGPIIAVTCSYRDTADGPWSATQMVGQVYLDALQAAGGVPLPLPHLDCAEDIVRLLAPAAGLLVTGGPDFDPRDYGQQPHARFGTISPERDRLDRIAIRFALDHPHMPILGICRGIQAINVVAGGSLIQDIPSQVEGALKHSQSGAMYYGTHDITIAEESRLAEIVGSTRVSVNSAHHQAVLQPAPGWRVVARADDGVIEAIEREQGCFALGCQFHPEVMARHDERMAAIFRAFVAACRACAAQG